MCGMVYIHCTRSDSDFEKAIYGDHMLKKRGPDSINIHHDGLDHFAHYLLSITGVMVKQPRVEKNKFTAFNGEIYNYKELGYNSEIDCISSLSTTANSLQRQLISLNGEFSIIIVDLRFEVVIAITDIFGTKPLWHANNFNGFWGLASYPTSLANQGLENKVRLKANQIYFFEKQTGNLINRVKHYKFNLNQTKSSYDGWINAFEESVRIRATTDKKVIVPMSGGYDSGCIAAAIKSANINSKFLTIKGEEDMKTVKRRMNLLGNRAKLLKLTKNKIIEQSNYLKQNSPDFYYSKYMKVNEDYRFSKDPGSIGLSAICEKASSEGIKVLLSGQGADEICSDYGYKGMKISRSSTIAGLYPKDLRTVYPWVNFYDGANRCYLLKDEYVTGSHGLEGRYPFLDKHVVQEFISLNNKLKNRRYKAPLAEYLDYKEFPYNENRKVGFNSIANIEE